MSSSAQVSNGRADAGPARKIMDEEHDYLRPATSLPPGPAVVVAGSPPGTRAGPRRCGCTLGDATALGAGLV